MIKKVSKLLSLLKNGGNKDKILAYEEIFADSIEEIVKEDVF